VRILTPLPPYGDHMNKPIILYDAACRLCCGLVGFFRPRLPETRFIALQSETGLRLRRTMNMSGDMTSIVYLDDRGKFVKTDAVIAIARTMNGLWPLAGAMRIVPRKFRDFLYDTIARNRYHWFGTCEPCNPTTEIKD